MSKNLVCSHTQLDLQGIIMANNNNKELRGGKKD